MSFQFDPVSPPLPRVALSPNGARKGVGFPPPVPGVPLGRPHSDFPGQPEECLSAQAARKTPRKDQEGANE
jgi:hypothetical protein